MVAPADLVEGREAFTRRAWGTAYERLRAVGIPHLASEDLGRLATAAYLVGDRDIALEIDEVAVPGAGFALGGGHQPQRVRRTG